MRAGRLALAAVVATVAFVAYSRTLLPGVDLGDTGGFQAAVAWPETTARQAYPLYYALATPFVETLSPSNPARGLNLFSAVLGAAAAGLLAWAVAAVGGSLLAGAAAGLLLAFSYTFWAQSVIAEVYTLHLASVALCFLALHAYATRPTLSRLALFCAVYAVGFGNHLSMILLFLPCAVFIVMAHPRPRELVRLPIIAMALLIAAAGALAYTPNFLAMWSSIDAPDGVAQRVSAFWFDVTKADWRGSMVLGVDRSRSPDQLAMWLWDARQQFGLLGIVVAAAGAIRLWWISRPWAVLLLSAYSISTVFTLTYNVGDSHVFFLPGHLFTAFAAGIAVAPPRIGSKGGGQRFEPRARRPAIAWAVLPLTLIAYAGWRGWSTWPAADRHTDLRGDALVDRLLLGIDEQRAVLLSDLNWDQENALLYSGRHTHRSVAWVRLPEVMPHLPWFVRDNLGIGRDVVLTARAAATLVAAYGDAFPLAEDPTPWAGPLSSRVETIPRGSPYVLTLLTPLAEYPYDNDDVSRTIEALTGGHAPRLDPRAYIVIGGIAGEAPAVHQAGDRPFSMELSLAGDPFMVRMDAWLPSETFRRGGFGHVLRGREPVLFVERGVSLVWFNRDGSPVTTYAGGPYAPERRFRIPARVSRLARGLE